MKWTEQDLVAFQDGEMGEADAARMASALREDAEMRGRLVEISRMDGAVLEAMGRFVPARKRRVRGWVKVAVLLLAASPAAVWLRPAGSPAADSPVRVVLSVPLPREVRAGPESTAPVVSADPTRVAMADAPTVRPVRSAERARVVLDGLSEAAQVEACERWAAEPHLRPVAFERLRELRRSGTAEVMEAAARLETDPGLRGWVSSYLPGVAGADRMH